MKKNDFILLVDQKSLNKTALFRLGEFTIEELKNVKMTKYKEKDFLDIISRIDLLCQKSTKLFIKVLTHTYPALLESYAPPYEQDTP